MKNRSVWAALSPLVLCSMGINSAHASEVLFDGSGWLRGTESFTDSLDIPTSGILTVTLGNIAFPDPLGSLDLLMTSPSGLLGPEMMGAGTETFAVTAGNVEAQWFGTAQGPLNTGMYSLNIAFQASAVPLPPSIVLLLSGLGLMLWPRRTPNATLGHEARHARDLQAT